MAVPRELLDQLAQLEGPIAALRNAVDRSLASASDPTSKLVVGEAIRTTEQAVGVWLDITEQVEARLLEHQRQHVADSADVQARIGGLALLHLAAAADVAALEPLDRISDDALVRDGEIKWDRASTIQDTAFGDGQVVNAISHELDEPDVVSGALGNDSDTDEIDDAVADIVRRGSASGTAVLIGLSGGAGPLFGDVASYLKEAVNVAPDEIRSVLVAAMKRITRLVLALVARATTILTAVLGGYREATTAIVEAADPVFLVAESFASRVLSRMVRADAIRAEAKRRLAEAANPRPRVRRIQKLMQSNQRWVGPVRIAAKGLPKMWAVFIGPIPSAPVAAVAMLSWTLLITGDQLDASGYPNLWKGVIRRAGGE